MIRLLSVLAFACATMGSAKAEERKTGLQQVVQEIRAQIKDIYQALAETTRKEKNAEEICFRLGNLYQTARHELEEVAGKQTGMAKPAKELVESVIKDAKSLPSFCGDKEKVKQDPGYEQVPKGDVADLKRELNTMDERAARLASSP